MKQEDKASPCSTSARNVHIEQFNFFTILFATCPQMTTKAPQVLVWGLQINFCEKAIINLESQNNEINYVFYFDFFFAFLSHPHFKDVFE